ncbi:solute carrier family 35 member F5-like isoform X2 [Halichondria panicea]|uniref:solute carrier family 35 member F5-like isoform X2 n=1 Tax=Halichondria panicea TaxID=6063 RepID=UPI00312B44F4
MAGRIKKCFKRFLKRTGIRKGLIGGVLVLVVVDLIWVGSAALSRIIYTQEAYNKPLFATYFKTSLFSIYLTAFIFWRPWQRLCVRGWRIRDNGERQRLLSPDATCSNTINEDHAQSTFNNPEYLTGPTTREECTNTRDDAHSPSSTETTHNEPPTITTDTIVPIDMTGDNIACSDEQLIEKSPAIHSTVDVNDHLLLVDNTIKSNQSSILISATPPEILSPLPVEPEVTVLPVQPEVTVCPLAGYMKDERVLSMQERSNLLTFRGAESAGADGDMRVISCPINPELEICLLGPPEYEPLGCYEPDSSSEDEHKPTEPLSPCHDKCCKVRFKRTVEVREVTGEGEGGAATVGGRRLFKKKTVSQHKEEWKRHQLLPVWKVALMAALFGVVWFLANYLYSKALYATSVASVNTLSSTSGVFVMVLAALPCLSVTDGDKITISRCIVTLISVGGAALVSLSPSGNEGGIKFSTGALYALGGAVLYAVYLVLLRRAVTHHDSLDIPMFFGFVGLFDSIFLLPLLVVWHYTGLEVFQLPPTADVWTLLLVNGFVGTVLSELLWLWGVFLTSPLMGTLALSLVTPLSITYSIVIGQANFSWMFVLGAVLIIISFVGVTVLDHFGAWDPLWAGAKILFLKARDYRHHREFRALSRESQRLITDDQIRPAYCQDYLSPT